MIILRRERGCGERVYTTEILAELSQRAGTVQCESEALWKPGRAARLQRGCFSSLPLEPLLIVVLKRLDFGGFLPPLFFSKIRKGFIKPQVPLRRRMTPWTIQSKEFSRPEYCSGQPFPSPGDLPNPDMEPRSPALQADSLPAESSGKPKNTGMGSLSLLWNFPTQELNRGVLHWHPQ